MFAEIDKLKRGGHDFKKLYAAFSLALKTKGKPTVILAKTKKGYGMGQAGESKMTNHQQKTLNIEGKYATEVYEQIYESFHIDILNIDFYKNGQIQENIVSNTRKFFKEDFNIQDLPIQNAKSKIRAFDYLGPAFIKYNNINLKILNYSEIEQGSSIELSDGLLYPLNVIPEGKSKMLFEDYLRGLK